jgi:hypothetical protein
MISSLAKLNVTGTSIKSLSQEVVSCFVEFCEKQGINVNDTDSALKLCIALSLIGISVPKLCESVIPEVFVDWPNLCEGRDTPGICVFGCNTSVWVHMIQFLEMKEGSDKRASPVPSALTAYSELLAQAGIPLSLEHTARLFVLGGVTKQTMLNTVSQYIRVVCKNAVSTQAQTFVSLYVDQRVKFESRSCFEAFEWIFERMAVGELFMNELKHYSEHRGSIKKRTNLRAIQVQSGRLRLRDRLNSAEFRKTVKSNNDITQEAQDSFNGWCTRVRFSNNISTWLRQKLYFIRSQSFDITHVVGDMVSLDVAKAVLRCSIITPETDVIDAVISRMLYHKSPFKELSDFRNDALIGLPQIHRMSLTYPTVMRLYVSAYQAKWKRHWQAVHPELNHTIITCVERFVKSRPFNVASLIDTLADS